MLPATLISMFGLTGAGLVNMILGTPTKKLKDELADVLETQALAEKFGQLSINGNKLTRSSYDTLKLERYLESEKKPSDVVAYLHNSIPP